ncbi:DUF6538 domain-containing protein [Aurantimonas sp. A2-1-M11]|uniref:DUF6538 domain-containing protein n=1 Tax=Aurantimonas sp. A2-1-M11 TaxID=3113712 RepID=UPI002F92C003
MGIATGLERRGAVYYWRKRLPDRLAQRIGLTHVKLSLRTKEAQAARYLGACLNAKAADLLMTQLPSMTREQLETIFRSTFEQHSRKLALLADFSRTEDGFSADVDIAEEVAMGRAYCLFAKKGPSATINDQDRRRYREKGMSEDAMRHVEVAVDRMKRTGEAQPSGFRLAKAIEAAGAEVTAGTRVAAQPIYLRALGEALLRTKDRYEDDPLDFDGLIASLTAVTHGQEGEGRILAKTGPVHRDKDSVSQGDGKGHSSADNAPAGPVFPAVSMSSGEAQTVQAVGAKLIATKQADKLWDIKTARQANMIFDLFERFLKEEARVLALSDIRQHHLDAFEGFLRQLHKAYGKSPKDRTRTIAELRRESEQRPGSERGLSGATRNRHLTFLGQLLRRAKSAGIAIDPQLDLTEFRARKLGRGRNDRSVPLLDEIETFFWQPVFTGCAGWDKMDVKGEHVLHRAAFFGPLLAHYQGMRREEYCGLAVDDIVADNGGAPYVHVCVNEFRRLKNVQSIRNLALHPELIRLNFLEYLRAIQGLGYRRLFPDLYSPSSRSPLGDRLYDELLPALRRSGFTPHQIRHFFNNDLKQKRVSAEFRADLMGHGGKTETTERYCNPADIDVQFADLTKVSIVTAHLSPSPIQLVPWVRRKEIAPWSAAARAARNA